MWNTTVNQFKYSPQRQGKTEKKKNRRRKTELLTAANQLQLPPWLLGNDCESPSGLEWNGSQQSPSTRSRERRRCVHLGYFFRSVNAGQVDRSDLGVSGLAVQIFNFLVDEPMSICLGEILQWTRSFHWGTGDDARPQEPGYETGVK